MTRIALVTPDASFEADLRVALPDLSPEGVHRWREEYRRVDPTKVAADVTRDGALVVCIGPDLDPATTIALADAFDREHPEVCVILVADPAPDLVHQALRVGVRDVVAPTGDPTELGRAVGRALDTAQRRQRHVSDDPAPGHGSRVITVLSPKGGAGKTTVATNLAVGLAAAKPGQVAIVDLDVQFGDVATALQLVPKQGLGSVAACPEDVTPTMVKVFLTPHPSGLFALCAPDTPAEGDAVSHHHGTQALHLLAAEFAAVVVDTGAGIEEHTLAAIEASTDLVFVCTTDITCVRGLRKAIDALDQLGFTAQRRHLVLNRSDARVGLDVADIEAAIGMNADVLLPSSQAVPLSMNVGSPVIESDVRSPVARQLQKLVDRFAEGEAARDTPAASGFGIWRRGGR